MTATGPRKIFQIGRRVEENEDFGYSVRANGGAEDFGSDRPTGTGLRDIVESVDLHCDRTRRGMHKFFGFVAGLWSSDPSRHETWGLRLI